MSKNNMIFLCGDDKIINGDMIIEVDFTRSNSGVGGPVVTFIDGSREEYNKCSTNILKLYLKNHEMDYEGLDEIANVKPGWNLKERGYDD